VKCLKCDGALCVKNVLCGLTYKEMTIKLHVQHVYTNLKPRTNTQVKQSGFLQISRCFFVYFGNKDMYNIFKEC